jgi:AraC-like DNA-binding protein
VVSGKKSLHTPVGSWILTRGNAVFVKKGACIIEKYFDEVLCLMAFFIPDSYLRSFMLDNATLISGKNLPAITNDLVIRLKENEIMSAYYQSVLPYFSSEIRPSEQLMELKFKELLLNIITDPGNNELNAYLQTIISTQADELQRIMEANYYFNLSLDSFAKLCNRSLSSFKRDFRKAYNIPPHLWLQNRRLNYSRHLLFSTNKSINEISFECGFENSTHFSKVFKYQFGVPPLQFRKKSFV